MVVAIWLPELLWQAECVGRVGVREQAVIVGGRPDRGGTVAAASPAARACGVRVGQRMADAVRLCRDAVVLPGRVDRALDVAAVVHSRLEDSLGPVAWVTVGRAVAAVESDAVARLHRLLDVVRDDVAARLGVSMACGLAPTWIGADIAARLMAPAGLLHVVPRSQRRMLAPLSLKWLPGLDSPTVARFAKEGVLTFGDLAAREPRDLERVAGRAGGVFARLAAGEDDRAVPGGVPVQRVATCAPEGDARDAAVATVIERAARTGRHVREAHVRFCAAEGSHADRVERLAARSRSSLDEVARTLTSVVSRDNVGGPVVVTLTLSSSVESGDALQARLPRRRTA